MKILYVSELSGMGGGETSLLGIMTHISARAEVSLLCREEGELPRLSRQNGISVYIENYRRKKEIFRCIAWLRDFFRRHSFDAIHANDITSAALIGLSVTALRRKPEIYCTCHIQFERVSFFKRVLLHRVACIFCVSGAVLNNLKKQKIPNLQLCHLGVDSARFHDRPAGRIRRELQLAPDRLIISTIARYQVIKGQLKAVRAMETVIAEHPEVVYLLAGGCIFGNPEDREYEENVRRYIVGHGLQKHIFMLGERRDIPEILRDTRLLLIPSDNESFGMAAVEAIESGVDIVSTPCDGTVETLEHDRDMLCAGNTSQALADQVLRYLNSPEMQARVHRHVLSLQGKYTLGKTSEAYYNTYICHQTAGAVTL